MTPYTLPEPVAYIRRDQLKKAQESAFLCEVTPEFRPDLAPIFSLKILHNFAAERYATGLAEGRKVPDGWILVEKAKTAILTDADVYEIEAALKSSRHYNRLAYALVSRLGHPELAQLAAAPEPSHD